MPGLEPARLVRPGRANSLASARTPAAEASDNGKRYPYAHLPGLWQGSSQPIRQIQKFCSPACQVTNNRAEHRAKQESARRIRVRECPGCLAKFKPSGRQKFCSRQCQSRLWQRTRLGIADPGLIGTCWWCHDEFSLLDGRRLYCSTECARFVKSLWNVGKYGITRDDYREAWYRQDGKCAICRQPGADGAEPPAERRPRSCHRAVPRLALLALQPGHWLVRG